MKSLVRLYNSLSSCNTTDETSAMLRNTFELASAEDLHWLVAILTDKYTQKIVGETRLKAWAMQESNTPQWLFDECRAVVGNNIETISLLVDGDNTYADEDNSHADSGNTYADEPLHEFMSALHSLTKLTSDAQELWVLAHWRCMSHDERFILNKLITGTLRLGVSKGLVLRAQSEVTGVTDSALPYPFCLASPFDISPHDLGNVNDWQVEWKWDGFRAQVVIRDGELHVWTRGEELVTELLPELHGPQSLHALSTLHTLPTPGTESGVDLRATRSLVLDGELLCFESRGSTGYAAVSFRLKAKSSSVAVVSDNPVVFMAVDILEYNGVDLRARPLSERRVLLEKIIGEISAHATANRSPENNTLHSNHSPLNCAFQLSPILELRTWTDLSALRDEANRNEREGLMIKRRDSIYHVGRVRGTWWKWRKELFLIDVVLVSAQPGEKKRTRPYSEYTFAIWKEGQLVPVARCDLGPDKDRILEVDAFVRLNTLERFGPVRTVVPALVFSMGFHSLERSSRHKSGVSVRHPIIYTHHRDKKAEDADTIETINAMLKEQERRSKT
ncbi:MAG: hypothetical protein SGJ05_12365 [bacterium]|nr:hypothetical protein [bacterium]